MSINMGPPIEKDLDLGNNDNDAKRRLWTLIMVPIFMTLLVLSIVGGVGYYFYKKRR